jgi:hypothetical protein
MGFFCKLITMPLCTCCHVVMLRHNKSCSLRFSMVVANLIRLTILFSTVKTHYYFCFVLSKRKRSYMSLMAVCFLCL